VRPDEKITQAISIYIAQTTHRVSTIVVIDHAENLKSGEIRRCHIYIAALRSTVHNVSGAGITSARQTVAICANDNIAKTVPVYVACVTHALTKAIVDLSSENAKSNRTRDKCGQIQRR
jgi:hypothetical protein